MQIAVFRALQLGDLLCAVPALRALRRAFGDARITLIGLPWAHGFAERFGHYVDAHLAFPGYPGLPEQTPDAGRFPDFIRRVREQRFDLALQMHGDGRITNGVVREFGARAVAGFAPADEPAGGGFLRYPARGPEIRRLLRLVRSIGAAAEGDALEFPLTAQDRAELDRFAAERGLPRGECICLHPGARSAERRWPAKAFARVGDELHRQTGLPIVLTGSESERSLTAAVRARMRAPAADGAGPISIGALAMQVARARLVVTNDTGVSHIAAALRVPSVVIFRASEMERWAPLDRRLHRPVWDPAGERVDAVLGHARALVRATARARSSSLPRC